VRLFGGCDLEAWRSLHLEGREQCPFLLDYLPSLPPEEFQARISEVSGRSGLEHAWDTYAVIQRELADHAQPLQPSSAVLDFGCGWGRIIRFFTRDVEPANLWGVDVLEPGIQACRDTNRWARFERNDPLPPTGFGDRTFDLIYSYSVFSHLAEEPHLLWLEEFARILKPGGLFIATTLPREYAELTLQFANKDPESRSDWEQAVVEGLPDPAEFLAAYDRGEYCFRPVPSEHESLGLTAISEQYARRRWSDHFEVCSYFSGPGQVFVTARKPPANFESTRRE
jgi:SAM-dependent methyltransferase